VSPDFVIPSPPLRANVKAIRGFCVTKVAADEPTTSVSLNISWREANRAIFDTLEKWNLKICLFVCGMRVIRLKAKHPWGSGMRPGT